MPKGVYKHKPHQGFQKGHESYSTKGQFQKGCVPFLQGKKGYFKHSKETKSNMSKRRRGHKNPAWKGGKLKHSAGYVLLYRPSHPNANMDGYVLRSHIVVEKHIGRYLAKKEVVHHINKIKDDDRLDNLQLFNSHSEHMKFHREVNHGNHTKV